jgi:hypothetical protein
MSVAFKYRETAADDLPPSISDDEGKAGSAVSPARFDVCPTWLELAARYLSDARAAQATRITGWSHADDIARADALEWEFEASLQAIVACGIAVEAFSAAVRSKIQLPQSLVDQWRENSTPRYIQIAEILRRALSLSAKGASGVRQCVGEILRFRDLAVDPSQKSGSHVFHPELRVGVEWRFAYFRYENASMIVQATTRLIAELVTNGNANDVEVQQYVDALRPKVEPLLNLPH